MTMPRLVPVLVAITIVASSGAALAAFDADQDGLSNVDEFGLGTSLLKPDTDGDQLCDGGGGRKCIDPITQASRGRGETEFGGSVFFSDTDNDGLSDLEEARLSPLASTRRRADSPLRSPDTDGDGALDGTEVSIGTDPLQNDTDHDGLLDYEEIYDDYRGIDATNATDPDSDDDGLSDGDEVLRYATNPASTDSEGDGVPDAKEIELGLEPWLDDSDMDRMPDAWEIAHGLDPRVAGGKRDDVDKDGLTDFEEWAYGTNPHQADSDRDGMGDHWEIISDLNATADDGGLDADQDGLRNIDEYLAHTDARTADTDGDGLLDGAEVFERSSGAPLELTDPLSFDTDNDVIGDLAETRYWLARANLSSIIGASSGQLEQLAHALHTEDIDGDGLGDGAELIALATDPATNDTDSDGITDVDELARCRSDPHQSGPCNAIPLDGPDGDEDGIPDAVEDAFWGVARSSIDMDGDGLFPRADPDSDNDGVADGVEIAQVTLPHRWFYLTFAAANDTDNDGLQDGEEAVNDLTTHARDCRPAYDPRPERDDPDWGQLWRLDEGSACWYVTGAWGIRLYPAIVVGGASGSTKSSISD